MSNLSQVQAPAEENSTHAVLQAAMRFLKKSLQSASLQSSVVPYQLTAGVVPATGYLALEDSTLLHWQYGRWMAQPRLLELLPEEPRSQRLQFQTQSYQPGAEAK